MRTTVTIAAAVASLTTYVGALNCSPCSSSRMVSTAVLMTPSLAPREGLDRVRTTVRFPSATASSTIVIGTSLNVSPAAKVRTWVASR